MALETISGLTLSSQNYSEAIDLLKYRYGNPQTLINSYMEQFVNLETVTKSNDVIRLRKLFNKVENSLRNLRSLGVDSDNFGKLLVPVLNSKLPSDMRTLFGRKFSGKVWNLDEMLEIFRYELEAKKQASLTVKSEKGYEKSRENCTTGALYSTSKLSNYQDSSRNPASGSRNSNKSCLFCQGNHPLFRCTKVTDPSYVSYDLITRILLQNVPQVTVVKNAKVVTTFRFLQKILRMIIKPATVVKIVKIVKIKTHIKMIIKQRLLLQIMSIIFCCKQPVLI